RPSGVPQQSRLVAKATGSPVTAVSSTSSVASSSRSGAAGVAKKLSKAAPSAPGRARPPPSAVSAGRRGSIANSSKASSGCSSPAGGSQHHLTQQHHGGVLQHRRPTIVELASARAQLDSVQQTACDLQDSDEEPEDSDVEPEIPMWNLRIPMWRIPMWNLRIPMWNAEDSDVEPEDSDVEPEDSDVEPEDSDVEPEDSDVEPEDSDVEPEDSDVEPEDSDVEPEIPMWNLRILMGNLRIPMWNLTILMWNLGIPMKMGKALHKRLQFKRCIPWTPPQVLLADKEVSLDAAMAEQRRLLLAFDALAVVCGRAAELDGFSAPRLRRERSGSGGGPRRPRQARRRRGRDRCQRAELAAAREAQIREVRNTRLMIEKERDEALTEAPVQRGRRAHQTASEKVTDKRLEQCKLQHRLAMEDLQRQHEAKVRELGVRFDAMKSHLTKKLQDLQAAYAELKIRSGFSDSSDAKSPDGESPFRPNSTSSGEACASPSSTVSHDDRVVSPGNLQLLHAQFASLPEDSTGQSPPPARRDQLAELDAGAPQRRAGDLRRRLAPNRTTRNCRHCGTRAGAETPCCSAGWRTWRPSSRAEDENEKSLHDRLPAAGEAAGPGENKAKSKISMNYDELKFKLESIERAQSMADLSLSAFSTLGGGPAFSGPEGRGGGSSGAEDSDSAAGSSLMSRSMYVPSSGGTSGGGGGSGGAARRRGLQHDRNKRRTISTAGDGGARDSAVVAAAAAAFSAALMDGDDNE
uniref:Kinesin motor domain-containing protein n=1 Tax=Macrostomum lignano TaxID=282301 RepID=A0A1I8FDR9_9PLAT